MAVPRTFLFSKKRVLNFKYIFIPASIPILSMAFVLLSLKAGTNSMTYFFNRGGNKDEDEEIIPKYKDFELKSVNKADASDDLTDDKDKDKEKFNPLMRRNKNILKDNLNKSR